MDGTRSFQRLQTLQAARAAPRVDGEISGTPRVAAARRELFDYLEPFYNGRRRHSALGYLSPRAFEQQREYAALAT